MDQEPDAGSTAGLAQLSFDGPLRLSTHTNFNSLNQPYDIGNIAGIVSRLSREEKFLALNNLYKPPSTFVFPQHTEGSGSHKRSFQNKWLTDYAWLACSKEKDGGYCAPCVFFSKGDELLGKLVNTPGCSWILLEHLRLIDFLFLYHIHSFQYA